MPYPDLVTRRLRSVHSALEGVGLSRAEVLALTLLLLGGLALGGLLWMRAGSPAAPSPTAAGALVDPSASPTTAGLALIAGSPSADPSPPGTVVVHVTGRVGAPGLVELPAGSRVGDALAAAGGPVADAAPDALNLARLLVDGEQLHVPAVGESVAPVPPPAVAAAPGAAPAGAALLPDGRLDLNRATAEDLEELPNIGPVTAEKILQYREEIGGFTDVGELRDVPGIGEKTFQGLVEQVGV